MNKIIGSQKKFGSNPKCDRDRIKKNWKGNEKELKWNEKELKKKLKKGEKKGGEKSK